MAAHAEELLREIAAQLQRTELTSLEIERAERELEKVRRRLETNEYARSSFIGNTYCVPERARDVLVEVKFYASLGRRWASLFRAIGLKNEARVLDLGPGFTPKVELGLLYAGFAGEVVAVDQDLDALTNLRDFTGLFDPSFQLETQVSNFLEDEIAPGDVVAANHLIDDVILDDFCRTHQVSKRALYLEENEFRTLWRLILAEREAVLDRILPKLTTVFSRLVHPKGSLIVVQYPSYLERLMQMESVTAFCDEVLKKTAIELEREGFVRDLETPARALAEPSERFGAEACYLLRRVR